MAPRFDKPSARAQVEGSPSLRGRFSVAWDRKEDTFLTLIFIRHGESVANTKGVYQGQGVDTQLTNLGRRQANLLAERLKEFKIDRIYTSPLRRARETAKIIASKNNCRLIVTGDLVEINHGQWEGKTSREVRRTYPRVFKVWKTKPASAQMPNGENCYSVLKRVRRFLRKVRGQDCALVVIAHDVVLRIILVEILGLPINNIWRLRLDNNGLTIVELTNRPILTLFNDTSHLKNLVSDVGKQAF